MVGIFTCISQFFPKSGAILGQNFGQKNCQNSFPAILRLLSSGWGVGGKEPFSLWLPIHRKRFIQQQKYPFLNQISLSADMSVKT